MTETTPNAMRLRARINSYAKSHGIMPQVVLQNYMFECFLSRLSKTRYSENFILKGGILVSSIVGLDVRSTMDMDATLKNLELSRERIVGALDEIISVPVDDDIGYKIISVEPIRKDDVYGGFCVRLDAIYESIATPLSIDISTGDAITPEPLDFFYKRLFSEDPILIRSYPVETVLAEKLETIVTRSILNTRPRDFYDAYVLSKTVKFSREMLQKALIATSKHRGTNDVLQNELAQRIAIIESSADLKSQWKKIPEEISLRKGCPV